MSKRTTSAAAVDLEDLPGYHIRRLHQIAVAVFLEETAPHGVTPVQYGVLHVVGESPGIDQRTLARAVGIDTSTIAGVVDRLQARGLMLRHPSPADRRVRMLKLTGEGRALLRAVVPSMLRSQQRMLEPLPPAERAAFMRMLRMLVTANNALSRAPSEA
jgi:MarR family transcriptional regulator, lower aerobic nicotinate degradation pathway regulator